VKNCFFLWIVFCLIKGILKVLKINLFLSISGYEFVYKYVVNKALKTCWQMQIKKNNKKRHNKD